MAIDENDNTPTKVLVSRMSVQLDEIQDAMDVIKYRLDDGDSLDDVPLTQEGQTEVFCRVVTASLVLDELRCQVRELSRMLQQDGDAPDVVADDDAQDE